MVLIIRLLLIRIVYDERKPSIESQWMTLSSVVGNKFENLDKAAVIKIGIKKPLRMLRISTYICVL